MWLTAHRYGVIYVSEPHFNKHQMLIIDFSATHVMVACGDALPASSFVLTRQLFKITRLKSMSSNHREVSIVNSYCIIGI